MREDKLSFEDFKDYVTEHIKEFLPDQYTEAEIHVGEVMKKDYSYQGMKIIRPGDRIVPTINLDMYYSDYISSRNPDIILKHIASFMEENTIPDIIIPDLSDYEAIKESLFIQICDRDSNMKYLTDIPYRETDGLAVTSHILFQNENGSNDQISSTPVTKEMVKSWGITEEQLAEDARNNSAKILPAKYAPLEGILAIMSSNDEVHMPDSENLEDSISMIIVTNEAQVQGASAMFYDGLMDRLSDMAGCDLYILPSSKHEVIVLPEKMVEDYHGLEDIVYQVNSTIVDKKDWLSDHVYHYDAKDKILERAETHEQRLSQKKKEKDSQTKEQKEEVRSGNKKPEKRSVLDRLNEKKAQVAGHSKTNERHRASEVSI